MIEPPKLSTDANGHRHDQPLLYKSGLDAVCQRIAAAASKCGRTPDAITLLAVSKQQPATAIRELAALGVRNFGESYLQEALAKREELDALELVWHYIGQVQSNKTRAIAERFDWVHTVDRLKIAQRLSEQRPTLLAPLNICLQIKLADEPGKGGANPADAVLLARAIAQLPNLQLRGLMAIPPPSESYEQQLFYFMQLAELAKRIGDELQRVDVAAAMHWGTLSMGMSGDLEAAIAAGATIVRVGTAIFGERSPHA